MGKEVNILEAKLKKKINANYCIAVSNGTSALELSLQAIDIKDGDEVITTSFSWISSASCILSVGAKPVLVDINYSDYNINPDKIEKKNYKKNKSHHSCKFIWKNCKLQKNLKNCKKEKN